MQRLRVLVCGMCVGTGLAAPPRVAAAEGELWQHVTGLLEMQLWRIEGHTVTVQGALGALAVALACIVAARSFAWWLRCRILPRTRLDENTAAITAKLLFYLLVVTGGLCALQILGVPLGAFAFLGGALAIGIGFGAQNIVNNFISGFIIMGERPIRVGDLIEIEGSVATVEEVGARCTRIRTADNVHILVPNSKFLEQSIVNWTLSNKQVRVRVRVGVCYGSPVAQVRDQLLEAARQHPDIRRDPAPYVRFDDFGDNALQFDLYFWVEVLNIYERKRIASEMRFAIDAAFRNAGIVIAFPQRDVHLDAAQPLAVRIISGSDTIQER